jgi:type I site-specific restriction endonuclease
MPTEADSRMVIDRKLREAGWNVEDKTHVATEETAADGRADYLLLDARGRPLALMLKRLFQAGRVQRVLFLADRIELARQAKEETFDIYLSDYSKLRAFAAN